MNAEKFFKILGAAVTVGTFGILVRLENRRPLRRSVESKLTRSARNLAVAGCATIALQVAESPVANRLTKLVRAKNLGLLKIVRLPLFAEIILAVLLLDYTLYLWHILTHKIPFFWRFHAVHHVDLDLDATTALRFHFGELTISVLWRAAQILLIGVSPASLAAWQMFLFPSILFHHSNVRLSPETEKRLQKFIVTPRMHGIHHSIEKAETDSNWSSGLAMWDFLHGTFRGDVPQGEIIVGVPEYQEFDEVTLEKIMTMPFRKQRSARQQPQSANQK